jgi:two-component system response regulator HydG
MTTRESHLMLIEDDEDICDLIVGFFKPRGFVVSIFGNAEAALKKLEDRDFLCDVILTDLNLPSMTGIELTQRVCKTGLNIPIILITATKSAEVAIQAIEAGAYDFIVKPLHFPQLLVSVERALHLNKIRRENTNLKAVVKAQESASLDGVIGRSAGFLRALDLAKRVAESAASVFISGESGTGKEVIARAIHGYGKRRKAPFIAINCSAIPENLLESELFGHAKGAFTGAADKKIGLFEEAEGGTLFLDEIGDLSLPLQAKLLRVLQERKIKRIGENQYRAINVRVISATHKDLEKEVAESRFRDDLFFRLNVIPIALPPLRDRREDIMPLAEFFLTKYTAINGVEVKGFAKHAIERLFSHVWRGNVRELENRVERAVVLCQSSLIEEIDLFGEDRVVATSPVEKGVSAEMPLDAEGKLLKINDLVDAYIHFALERNGGAKDKTARELGIDRKTLYRRLQDSADVRDTQAVNSASAH